MLQKDHPTEYVHSYGAEVKNKTVTFKPEFFATDSSLDTKITVAYDCPDVMHTPFLQSSRRGGDCIHTYECPQGTECRTDRGFSETYPELSWMDKKTCRSKEWHIF